MLAMRHVATEDPRAMNLTPRKIVKVEHDGKTLGYFLPAPPGWDPDDEETKLAFDRLREAVRQVREESGLTEDELVCELASWRS
jgi:hypothetical protein